ncbi:hypothetical protein N802_12890 [Knoellia sinensis KCTC 19936]|uniref:Uncharacterized protein n=1 Tax=Knoellia sinensis KCTC 19936 TaxID=1385520 RepID=A0A0A0JED8_9MICO|nr:hypothetical protein [Knoellia sinensis]KGN34422.1 hypothetical protein N802_12890 [Knoellia sinensis KCTC 19936]
MSTPRSPNHLRVLIVGAVLGFAIGAFLGVYRGMESSSRVAQGEYSTATAVGYLGLLGALVVGLLAAGVSVLIESVSERRNR